MTRVLVSLSLPTLCAVSCQFGVDADNEGAPWFEERSIERGVVFRLESGHDKRYLMPELTGGGAALFDMDADGDLDAYLVQGGGLETKAESTSTNQLFSNDGAGIFENVTTGSGSADPGYGMGVATGDYDNDGDADVYIANVGSNALLKNLGNGRFDDVTREAGVGDQAWGTSAVFVDYDADGDLDLFVANYMHWSPAIERPCTNASGLPDYCYPPVYKMPAVDVLYRNDGTGSFSDVSDEAGMETAFGYGFGTVAGDFTGDGLADIFVANDGSQNQLWVNQGGDSFADQALSRGCALGESGRPKAGMGVTSNDFNDDGKPDLLVVNLQSETDSYFRNEGPYFVDASTSLGLSGGSDLYTRFGVGIVDFDNDGYLDGYFANGRINKVDLDVTDRYAEPNLLYSGVAGVRFEEVTPRGGTKELLVGTSRAAAFGDVDNDGGVDVLVVNRNAQVYLLHNLVGKKGNWITFRLVNLNGADALGAILSVDVAGQRRWREARTAYSFQAANDPRVHIGLGDISNIAAVEVRWPEGKTERFGDCAANQVIQLVQGTGEAVTP